MNLVAVIVAYWPERYGNIQAQIDMLEGSTLKPDLTIVVNNNPRYKLPSLSAPVIQCGRNFTSRSKYAIAMLEPAHNYVLIDDDTAIEPTTLERMMAWMKPGYALCDYGVKMVNNHLSQGKIHHADEVHKPTKVDAFVGRLQVLSHGAVVKYLQAEGACRVTRGEMFRSVGEDILIAMCNPDAYVVPLPEEARSSIMHLGSKMMQNDWGYYQIRDYFAYECRRALHQTIYPNLPKPGDEYDMEAIESYLDLLKQRDAGDETV